MRISSLALPLMVVAILSILIPVHFAGQAPGELRTIRIPASSQGQRATPVAFANPAHTVSPSTTVAIRSGSPPTIPVGLFPVAVAYNPVNKELYVSDYGSPNGTNNISVVNTTLNRVVATIEAPFGVGPLAVSASGYVYFGDYDSTVYAVSPYTNQVVSAVPLGAGCPHGCNPQPVAYDSQNGDIYVVDISSDNVSVIHTTSLVASIPVGVWPNGAVYDPSNGEVYVENEGGSITIINGSTNRVVESAPLPDPGPGLAYDPSNGDIYVCQNTANYGNVVSVVSAATGQIVDTIPVGPDCNSEVLDSSNGFLYVPNEFQSFPGQGGGYSSYQRNVTVIDTRTNEVVSVLPVQQAPYGITYDPANRLVYVADAFTNNLSVLPPIYNITLRPGPWLPPAATWTLTMANLTLWSNASSIRFAEPNGTYNYTLQVIGDSSLNTTGFVTVNGADISISLTRAGRATYPVIFSEAGLPSDVPWSAMLAGSSQSPTTGSIAFTKPNGTYAYSIADVPGWHQATLPYAGSVTVNGTAVTERTLAFTEVKYAVTFTETGMPFTAGGGVTLNRGSLRPFGPGGVVTYSEPNGSYSYAITAGSGYGWVSATPPAPLTVSGGAFPVTVTFEALYTVTFAEMGLPSATPWAVTLGGFTVALTTSQISFTESNGTYSYTIFDLPGWHQTTLPYTGSMTVNGAAVAEPTLTFTQVTYTMKFQEMGLPRGTEWYVNLTQGPSSVTTTGALTLAEPNGTYSFTVETGASYVATDTTGSLMVAGSGIIESITFAETFGITFDRPSGTPMGAQWTVYVNTTTGSSGYTAVEIPPSDIVRTTTSSTLTVFVMNGTYGYSIVVSGNPSLTTWGTVTMDGSPVVANPPSTPSTFLGFSGSTGFYVLAAVVATVIVVGIVIAVIRHRRPPAAPPTPKN